MSTIDMIGSAVLVTALLVLNYRAFKADSAHMKFETKMMMGVSWVIIFGVLAFVLGRLQS